MIEHLWKNQAFVKLTKPQIEAVIMLLDTGRLPEELKAELQESFKEGLETIKHKKQPTVFDRIDEIDFTGNNTPLDGVENFQYSWSEQNDDHAGYEKLDSKNKIGGGHHYSGVYHPNVYCETSSGGSGPGICKHCGCTLF